jgi:hypothetical protein
MFRPALLLSMISALAVLAACGDGDILSGGTSTRVQAARVGGDGQTATVMSPVAVPPSVRVTNRELQPLPGVAVRFAVGEGGGSVTGGETLTDSAGLATVGSWVLGRRPGRNVLLATIADSLTVGFEATAVAGPPASLAKQSGDGQTGQVLQAVTAPSVLVRDAYENPVSGVSVLFTVTGGNGVVQEATQTTDGTGVARVASWVLGPTAGPNTLVASVTGLSPVTFTAIGIDSCANTIAYSLGSTVEGTLSAISCKLWGGEYTDRYELSVSATTSLRLDMNSDDFFPHLSLFDTDGAALASELYYCEDYPYCGEYRLSVRLLLGSGDYLVGAGAHVYGNSTTPAGGAYSFSSTVVPEDVESCSDASAGVPPLLVPGASGVTTTQRIETTDCQDQYWFRGVRYVYYYDQLAVYIEAGRTYTISMESTDFDTYLRVGGVSNDDSGGGSDSQIVFTADESALYWIYAGTHLTGETGSYTLTIE